MGKVNFRDLNIFYFCTYSNGVVFHLDKTALSTVGDKGEIKLSFYVDELAMLGCAIGSSVATFILKDNSYSGFHLNIHDGQSFVIFHADKVKVTALEKQSYVFFPLSEIDFIREKLVFEESFLALWV